MVRMRPESSPGGRRRIRYFHVVLLCRGFDAFPGGIAFRVSHALNLPETGYGVAHVSGVMNGFFPFFGESEFFIRDMIAGGFVDRRHASG